MTNYAIMRNERLKTFGSIAGAMGHCYRERETLNADPNRLHENEHMSGAATSLSEAMGRVRARLPEKRRKDAVLVVEYVMTASPEWWLENDHKAHANFFEKSRQWLIDKYGEDNLICATIHQDEKSPHLSAFVTPLTKDGRLSAKEYIGNSKKMSEDQDSFADAVKHLGLERGLRGSKATHKTVKQFYAELEADEPKYGNVTPALLQPKVTKKGTLKDTFETPDEVARRVTRDLKYHYRPAVTLARGAQVAHSEAKEARRRFDEVRARLVDAEGRLAEAQPFFDALRPLSETNQGLLVKEFEARAQQLLVQQQIEEDRKFRVAKSVEQRLAIYDKARDVQPSFKPAIPDQIDQARKDRYKLKLVESHYRRELDQRLAAKLRFVQFRPWSNTIVIALKSGGRVTDEGAWLRARTGDDESIQLMITMAQVKGWTSVNVDGDHEFRQRAAAALARAGIEVANPLEPDPAPTPVRRSMGRRL